MKRVALVMLMLAVIALPACSKKDKATSPQVPSWQVVTVDATGFVGSFSSLALDAAGRPRIAYCDFYGPLKYAERNGAAWAVQIADSLVGAEPLNGAGFASLALDAAGSPRISYQDWRTFDLRFAARNGDLWTSAALDEAGNVGGCGSLALDPDGHCHISYHDYSNGDLKYLTWTGAAYAIETVDFTTGTNVGLYTSIELDAQGDPHISYSSDGRLRYAAKSGGAWLGEEVTGASVEGFNTSLALDAGGNPRIAYQDGNRLKYASKSGATWTTETVDATATVGDYCSLALDAQGQPHIAYHDFTHGDLKYAVKSGGTWTVVTVDEGAASGGAPSHDVGQYASLALDAQGNPRIAYYDATTGDLRYAEWGVH